jgi:hypothetical protein
MIKRLLIAVAMLCAVSGAQVPVAPGAIPRVTFVDASGNPCAGCTLQSFAAGTTTPLPTFTDSTGTSQNTNPIILDASGGAFIWFGSNSYKLILKDALGNIIWTVDHVTSSGALPCSSANAVQSANSAVNGLTCDPTITINTTTHTINIGTLPPNHVSIGALGTPTLWNFDTTTPATALASLTSGGLQLNSINNVLSADQFTGADIGAKINAAFASCTLSNQSCKVTLPPNAIYAYSTTIVVPFQGLSTQVTGYPILDCQGATLNYSGQGDAVLVPPKAVGGWFSGKLENCVISVTTSARSIVHTQSAIGFKIENMVLLGNSTPVCLKQENVNNGGTAWSNSATYFEGDFVNFGGVTYTSKTNGNVNNTPPNATFWNVYAVTGSNPIWSEEMEVSKVSMQGCTKAVQLFVNGGTESFNYNDWHDMFVSLGPNEIGVSIEGVTSTIGSKLDLTSNSTGTPGHQAKVVSATGGATASFNTLTIRGESDGSATDCAIFTDSASFVFGFGSMLGSNLTTCYGAGAASSQIQLTAIQLGLTNLQGNPDNGLEVQAGANLRGLTQAANCKWDFLNGTPSVVSSVFQAGSAVFGLANPSGFTGPNCIFEIYRRTTTSGFPDVNIPGSSGNPITSAFYADSLTGNVGVGPGYGWNGTAWVNPSHGLELSSTEGTLVNCATTSCGSAIAGNVSLAAGSTAVTINTTSVTANSEIFLTWGVGATLPTNLTAIGPAFYGAITPGTSFAIEVPVAPATNPIQVSWRIVN